MQAQEVSRYLGQGLYKKLRKITREGINTFRAEKSSGVSGLKKAAAAVWQLDYIQGQEGKDAADKVKASLLQGKLFNTHHRR